MSQEVDKYGRVLDTIQVLCRVVELETTCFLPDVGPVPQGLWDGREEKAIKQQILGMLKLIPEWKDFNRAFDGE